MSISIQNLENSVRLFPLPYHSHASTQLTLTLQHSNIRTFWFSEICRQFLELKKVDTCALLKRDYTQHKKSWKIVEEKSQSKCQIKINISFSLTYSFFLFHVLLFTPGVIFQSSAMIKNSRKWIIKIHLILLLKNRGFIQVRRKSGWTWKNFHIIKLLLEDSWLTCSLYFHLLNMLPWPISVQSSSSNLSDRICFWTCLRRSRRPAAHGALINSLSLSDLWLIYHNLHCHYYSNYIIGLVVPELVQADSDRPKNYFVAR